MEQKTEIDVFPTITVGRGYGKFVDAFNVDINAITDRLRESGLTDEQIAETTIHFSDAMYPVDGPRITKGDYNPKTNEIQVYGIESIAVAAIKPSENSNQSPDSSMNRTLQHELEHRVAGFDDLQGLLNSYYELRTLLFGRDILIIAAISLSAGIAANQAYRVVRPDATLTESIILSIGAAIMTVKSKKYIAKDKITERYLNHPEEKRARLAEANTRDFIRIDVKHIS